MTYDRHDSLDVYKLQFEEFPGLTVRVRKANFSGLLSIAEAMPILRSAADDDLGPLELPVLRAWKKLCKALGDAIVSWDLMNGRKRVPATAAGVMAQDIEFIMALAAAWQKAMVAPRQERRARRPVETAPLPEPATVRLDGLNPDGTDPETGIDEEYLAQMPMQIGAFPLKAVN